MVGVFFCFFTISLIFPGSGIAQDMVISGATVCKTESAFKKLKIVSLKNKISRFKGTNPVPLPFGCVTLEYNLPVKVVDTKAEFAVVEKDKGKIYYTEHTNIMFGLKPF